jgi:phosphomannomutase
VIEEAEGHPVHTRVGHALIKPVMRRQQPIFAMEFSGPCYYADSHYTDNGLRTIIEPLLRLSTEETSQSRLQQESQSLPLRVDPPDEKMQAESD